MAFVVNEKLILDTLGFILHKPEAEVRKAVEEARARMIKSGARHWPPETRDENLVSLWDAVGPEGDDGRFFATPIPSDSISNAITFKGKRYVLGADGTCVYVTCDGERVWYRSN